MAWLEGIGHVLIGIGWVFAVVFIKWSRQLQAFRYLAGLPMMAFFLVLAFLVLAFAGTFSPCWRG